MRLFICAMLSLVLLVQACTNLTATTSVDYDAGYDFSKVRKIAIQPIARDTVATVLVTDQQISRINSALGQELERRGFEIVRDNAEADMFLSWRFIHKHAGELAPFDPGEPETPEGSLYINMIDPLVLQSKWRVTFRSDLRKQPETPEAAEYRRQAAEAIFAEFPPGGS